MSDTLRDWFCREILPHEAALTRFIRRNWRNESDIAELRQDVYAKVFEQAREQLSRNPFALPTMHLNPEVKDIFAFRYEDFRLENYQAHPHIKAKVAV